jgi:hypothetical protein
MDEKREEIREKNQVSNKMSKLSTVADRILEEPVVYEKPCFSLVPLALALMETFDLYSNIFDSSDYHVIESFFDANEESMPNIDTRLKCIRDLCSSTVYALQKRAEEDVQHSQVDSQTHLGQNYWVSILKPHTNYTNSADIVEAARLLDDLLESMIIVSETLHNLFNVNKGSWNEVYRHVRHIIDHYDYAEEFIISCLRQKLDLK